MARVRVPVSSIVLVAVWSWRCTLSSHVAEPRLHATQNTLGFGRSLFHCQSLKPHTQAAQDGKDRDGPGNGDPIPLLDFIEGFTDEADPVDTEPFARRSTRGVTCRAFDGP